MVGGREGRVRKRVEELGYADRERNLSKEGDAVKEERMSERKQKKNKNRQIKR